MIKIVPATQTHAMLIAPFLRSADVQEIQAAGHDVLPTVACSIGLSDAPECALKFGIPIAIWGVCPMPDRLGGIPWMLGTDDLCRHRKAILRGSKDWVSKMNWAYPILENHVHIDHRESVRWLSWLGFTVHPAKPWGLLGQPFHRFTMERAW